MAALINWIWQGCTLTVLVAAGLHACRFMNASTRELVWWFTLCLVLLMPVVPSHWLDPISMAIVTDAGVATVTRPLVDVSSQHVLTGVAVGLWAVWAVASIGRVMASASQMARYKERCVAFPVDRERRLTAWMSVRHRGRRAKLTLSTDIRSAGVLGLRQPVIATDPSLLDLLSDEDLDRVLVHEYAHVQRHDDVAALVQAMIRAVAGMHPAVWWIDRALSAEREVACDDWVIALKGSAKSYASCLTNLVRPTASVSSVVPIASFRRSQLTTRITRLLDAGRNTNRERSILTMAIVCPAQVVMMVGLIMLEPVGSAAVTPNSAEITALSRMADMSSLVSVDPLATGVAPDFVSPAEAREPIAATSALAPRTPARSSAAGVVHGPAVASAGSQTTAVSGFAARGDSVLVSEPAPAAGGMPAADDLAPLDATHHQAASSLPSASVLGATPMPRAASPMLGPDGVSIWDGPARAGIAVGDTSRRVAIATAGAFSWFGKSIAGGFQD
jgi:beta-lactamase regulating signal transducer with metallopeptidase domain